MSSSGVTAASFVRQAYFCHQCELTVLITPSPAGDILCPSCDSDFVEECQNPNPNPEPFLPDPFSLLLSQILSLNENPNPPSLSAPGEDSPLRPDAFYPASYLLDLFANRRASGVDYQFVMEEDDPSPSRFPLQSNIGDYFVGPGFEQLIQHLAENDPNRYGTPPASKSAVEALPTINVDEGLLKSEPAQCAVCFDDFEMGTDVKQMPCKHVYHKDCILPWLELHSSCPVCRFELPTDDLDNESRGGRGDNARQNDDEDVDVDIVGLDEPVIVERRFTIPLPWIFREFDSESGSDSGSEDPDQSREQN